MHRRRFLALLAVGGASGSVLGQEKGPGKTDDLAPLLRRFPHVARDEHIIVHSDLGRDFSQQHARHAEKVWKYFARKLVHTPGDRALLYYTRNETLFGQIAKVVPTTVVPGARKVTARIDKDHWKWFIMPYQVPDFGTQIHELSHSFLFANYAASEDYPWLKEGSGMFWENGQWTKEGELFVLRPLPSAQKQFRELGVKRMALEKLVTLPREEFYAMDAAITYSQSMIYIWYLEKAFPAAMMTLYHRLCQKEITDNDGVLSFLQDTLRLKLPELDRRYVEFDRRYGD